MGPSPEEKQPDPASVQLSVLVADQQNEEVLPGPPPEQLGVVF